MNIEKIDGLDQQVEQQLHKLDNLKYEPSSKKKQEKIEQKIDHLLRRKDSMIQRKKSENREVKEIEMISVYPKIKFKTFKTHSVILSKIKENDFKCEQFLSFFTENPLLNEIKEHLKVLAMTQPD